MSIKSKITLKNSSFKVIIVFSFVFVFFYILFLYPSLIFEVQAQCGSQPPTSQSCGNYTEYRCQANNSCDADILRRTCNRTRYRSCNCVQDPITGQWSWSCGSWGSCINPSCGGSSVHTNCQSWQVCQGNTSWSSFNHSCQCAGECLDDPTNTHLEDGIGSILPANVLLPIKLNWDDVNGANSYWHRVWEATSTSIGWEVSEATTTASTTMSEAIPGTGPCSFLQSTSSYSWKVAPCCNADGTECKDWDDVSTSTFDTSLAPELVSPEDPDWNNTTQMAIDVPIPVFLDWCDVEAAEYYKIKTYSLDSGIENLLGEIKVTESSGPPTNKLNSDWTDFPGLTFLVDNSYRWEVSTCFPVPEIGSHLCGSYSQKWGFETTSTLPDESFNLLTPPDDSSPGSAVGLPATLSWTKNLGFNSFNYQFKPINPAGPLTSGTTSASGVVLDLNLNTVYEWTARYCTDHEAQNCKPFVLPQWQFRTTGAPPTLKNPINGAIDVIIPIDFDWDDVSGAGFYRIQVSKDASFTNVVKEKVVLSSETGADYPDLEMLTNYWWRVQTCADQAGNVCGVWSSVLTFRTFQIGVPSNLSPPNDTEIKEATINLTWQAVDGAKTYQYIIYNPAGEEVVNKIVPSNSVSHLSIEFPEIGIYEWKVQACLDTGCSITGGWTGPPLQTFNLALIAPPEQRGGLVPCGKKYDDPGTPWNEREQCQIPHIFLLIRNVLDFLLFKIATIMLILILIVTGAIFYLSMGDSNTIFKVRSFLKSVVIGYLAIFFSWFFINLFLSFLGYKFQIFGHWWEIPL